MLEFELMQNESRGDVDMCGERVEQPPCPKPVPNSTQLSALQPGRAHSIIPFNGLVDETMQSTSLRHPRYSVLTQSFDQALPSK
jgi:hypothetical protein